MKMLSKYVSRSSKVLFLAAVTYSSAAWTMGLKEYRQQLSAQAEEYISQLLISEPYSVTVTAKKIDPRIQIPVCPLPINFSANPDTMHLTTISVKASCPSNNWYLYLSVKAIRTQQVVVLSHLVSPGTILTEQNVQVREIDVNTLRSTAYGQVGDVLGARVKRRLRAGQPISPSQLCFVCKGDTITISAKGSGLELKTAGIAQQDGKVGDTIRVKNANSNKLVRAKISGIGEVLVSI